MSAVSQPAQLALADGTVVSGIAIGAIGTTGGELCFNTSMTGYQEIFTDPSYYGQLMMMTYPHIGNYGVSERDNEAATPMAAGVIVRSYSDQYSNPLADGSLHDWLKQHGIVGITGLDTRRLVRHIRRNGVMNAIISSDEKSTEELVQQAKQWPSMHGLELASKVSREEPTTHGPDDGWRIAAFDYGLKRNIINKLVEQGFRVTVFPSRTPFDEVQKFEPHGYFFSNGPGDPNPMDYAVSTVEQAIATGKPIFGICLGHQVMALQQGIAVDKMYVGHRGANQPVKNLKTGRVEITTQNHGFSVHQENVDTSIAEVTHLNLNDGTVEGLDFKKFNDYSVQYHPEASPGPHDSAYLFEEFRKRLEQSIAAEPATASS